MPTIRDVAKYAGVSVGTASNVINNLPSVSEKNRILVNEAISALGFRKNQAASMLRSRISRSIGLILPDISNPFYPDISRGVEDEARLRGYGLFLCNKDRDARREIECINALLDKNVDGILLFKPMMSPAQLIELSQKCPVVLLDGDPHDSHCDTISVDDYHSVYKAVEALIDMGHRSIAFIAGRNDSISSRARTIGYKKAMEPHSPCPGWLCQGDYTFSSGYERMKELLSLPAPPTAVVCANDMMALGALNFALEHGIRVPDNVAIIGHDDIPFASICTPKLSTIWHPKYEMGQESVRVMMRRIQQGGQKDSGISVVMHSKLILRETTP